MNRNDKIYFLGVLLLALVVYQKVAVRYGPIVNTKYGQLVGIVSESRQGRPVYEFLGVPFAKEPTGALRFEPPQPPERWEGVRKATTYGNQCLQIELMFGILVGSESCLFLNVFTPKIPKDEDAGIPTDDENKLLPVLVYIHGGLFQNGGSDMWRPSYLLDDQDIILVTINYRLSALGFLSTGWDGIIRGNMGLKDQSMALRWVHENIKAFGGDKNMVTIMGESCGGMGAHYQMLSPMSKGLFSKIIAQSVTAFHAWTMKHEPRKQALRLGNMLGCPTEDTTAMVQCLKKVDASAIVSIQREIMDPLRDHISVYKPVSEVIEDENTFISKSPYEIVASGNYSKVPMMAGVNSDEGLFLAASIMANKTMADLAQDNWSEFARRLLMFEKNDNVAQKIRDFYFGNESNITTFDNLHRYARMVSDRIFFNDMHNGARLQSKSSPVYLYYYSYRGVWSTANLFMELRGKLPRLIEAATAILLGCNSWLHHYINTLLGRTLPNYGASHSDELALQFQMSLVSDIFQDSPDYPMSIDLVRLWVSFAKQMDKIDLTFRNVSWNPVNGSESTLSYLKIDKLT